MHDEQMSQDSTLSEEALLDASLSKLEHVSHIGFRVFQILFFLHILGILVLVVLAIVGTTGIEGQPQTFQGKIGSIASLVVLGVPTAIIIFIVAKILFDVSKGETLFQAIQVKRIRYIALAFVLEAFLGTLLSPGFASLINIDGWFSAGLVLESEVAPTDIPVNVSDLFFALILYCLSVAFEHAALLQRLSDETV